MKKTEPATKRAKYEYPPGQYAGCGAIFIRLLSNLILFSYLCKVIDTYCIFMDKLIETIVSAIEDKKGKNIVSLDLSGFDGAICSRFVVCNADSTTQVGAIAAGIEEKVFEVLGEKVWRIEGQQNAVWIAMDYVDVVVHIFQTELRSFYKLEELWADAPMTKYEYEV